MDVGIDLSVASLSAFALEQGITKSWQSMSQAEKISLRYQYILQATQRQQGDFANTSRSMANALRTLRAYAQSITETIGDGLASALRHVVRWMNRVAAVVLKVAKAFATFMHTLFGKNVSGGGISLGDDSAYEDVADDLDDAAASAGDTSSGLGDAADNAQKLAKSLSVLPFDELNQLNKDTNTSGSSSGGGDGGIGGLGDLGGSDLGLIDEAANALKESKLPEAVDEWAQRIKDAFLRHDWKGLGQEIAWGINKGLDWLYKILDPKNVEEKVLPWVRNFATVMNSLVDSIHWDVLGRTLGRGLNDLFLIANTWLTSFDWLNLGIKFAEGANGLVSEIRWDWMGQLFANGLNSLWQRAYGFVSTFDWVTLGLSLSEALKNFVNKVDYDSISGTVREGLNGIIDATYAFINDISVKDAEDLGLKLSNAFNDVISKVKWRKIGLTLKQTWNKAWALLKTAVRNLGKEGGGTGIGAAIHDALETAIAGVKTEDMTEAINTLVQKVSQDIIKVFGDTEMWYDLGYKIGGALSDIVGNKDTLKAAAGAINAIVDGLLAMFKGAIDALKDHKGEIGDSIASFLKELDWADILKIAAPIIGVKLAGAILTLKFTSITNALKLKLGLSLASGASEAAGSAATSGTVSGALSGLGTKLATLAGGNLAQSLAAWAGPLGVLGVSLVGATLGNTPEARAEVARAKSALDSDLKEGKKNVENTLYGTGESVEKLTGEITQQGIQRSSEFVNQLSIDMATLRNKGVITEDQFKAINKGIWSGNDTTIASAARLRDAWVSGDNDKIESTKKTADVVSALGINIGNSTVLADGFTKAYSIVHQTVGNVKSVVELAKDKVRLFADSISNSGTKANEASSLFTSYDTSVSGIFTKVETGTEWIKRMSDATKTSGDNASIAAQNQKNYNDAADKTPGIMDTVKTLLAGFATTLLNSFGVKTDYIAKSKEIPEGAKEGIDEGTPLATAAVATMAGAMLLAFTSKLGIQSPSTVFKTQANYIPQGVAEGIKLGTQVVKNAVKTMCDEMLKQFKTSLESIKTTLKNTGNTVVRDGLVNGFKSALNAFNPGTEISNVFQSAWTTLDNVKSEMYTNGTNIIDSGLSSGLRDGLYRMDIASEISSAFNSVWSALDSMEREMYDYGSRIGEALGDGMKNAHIDAPHIDIVDWGYAYYGDGGSVSYPIFDVSWYAKGALFTNPAIVGVGEAGDEAALPLENRRTMSRIARAIVDNSDGAFDIDEATLVSAVARGYVQAMMANQGNEKPINVYATLYTEDNEVLARAVQRGNQSIDYRNNPTPRYSY